MSRRLPPFKDYRFQTNSSATIIKTNHPNMNSANYGKISNFRIQSSLINENQDFYKFRYTLQDKADNSNIVFFDSASRKYRTRSASKIVNPQTFSKSIKNMAKTNLTKNDKYYNNNSNSINGNKNNGYVINKNNSKSNAQTYNNKISINDNKYINNKMNKGQEKSSQLNNYDINRNKQILTNKIETNNNYRKTSNIQSRNQEMEKKPKTAIISQKINNLQNQGNKNQIQKEAKNQMNYPINANSIDNKRNAQKVVNTSKINNSNPNNIPENNQKIVSNNSKNNKNIQRNQIPNKTEIKNQKNTEQNKQEQKSFLNNKSPISNKFSNIVSPNKANEQIKNNIEESKQKKEDNFNDNKLNKEKKEINRPHEKKGLNNVETSQKIEEKTIVLVPGQTIEKKTVEEKFEDPTEEVIESPDGTLDLILKQTKITKITENIPLESEKVQLIEGIPELPMYKQKITYNYETYSKSQNKNDAKREKLFQEYKQKKEKDENNDINRNLNEEEEFGENEDEELDEKINVNIDFDTNILPKGFKDAKELENFLNSTNNKGTNLTPEEKEKRSNCIKDLFNNIAKGGNKEQNLEKLSEILASMNEEERKEILQKLSKDGKNKNLNLLKKLGSLVEKQVSNNNNNLAKNKASLKKGFSRRKKFSSPSKNQVMEEVEIKKINPLKFDGLFLEISHYNNEKREKNPFDGPSPYDKFYKERSLKIKNKIINMNSKESE